MTSPVLLNSKSTGKYGAQNVVILHGLFGDLNNWRAQADRLAEHYRVHSMDLRNHGASPHVAGMTYSQIAADVAFTCDSMKITSTHIIGHSMGGKTAMQLALSRPNLVDRLVVVDIGPRRYPHHHNNIIQGLQQLNATSLNSRTQADELLQHFVAESGTRSFLLKNLKRSQNNEYRLRVNLDEIVSGYDDIADHITSDTPFEKPVLFIKGAESDYLTEADRAPIAALFTQPALKTIAGASHWPHSEKPDVIYKILADFLAAGARMDNA